MEGYVPAVLRGYPFALFDNSKGEKVLCIAEEHIGDSGEPLFDSSGNMSKPVQDVMNFLIQCEKNRKVTQAACQSLDQAGVIEKWSLQVKHTEDQDPVTIDGLYRISEKALNDLDADAFADLRKNGALALAYAQIFSMPNISKLGELAKYHAQQAHKQKSSEPDIEQLFGDGDILSFDNI
jgi:hypothetical protein